jgi:hypothetical protein
MAVKAGFMERNLNADKKPGQKITNKDHSDTLKRLNTLKVTISQAEAKYSMKYRPERPDFQNIIKTCAEG